MGGSIDQGELVWMVGEKEGGECTLYDMIGNEYR
jgi:hypothetical protein